jgi:SAM-dependent methyltransferase
MSTAGSKREEIHAAVQAAYGAVARSRSETPRDPCCSLPVLLGDYLPEELAAVPRDAYLGAGSGTPVRSAGLQPGEIVVDLGAGAGMDSFLAANQVGPSGRVYGFDLTSEMVERARHNASAGHYANVRFEKADIEHLPLPDGAADAAISNCVINLTPDKSAVYAEVFRVLRPGGRLSISDIVLRGAPEAVRAFRQQAGPENWCACVSGALAEEEYLSAIRGAGFADVRVVAERLAFSQPGGGLTAVAVTITGRKPA